MIEMSECGKIRSKIKLRNGIFFTLVVRRFHTQLTYLYSGVLRIGLLEVFCKKVILKTWKNLQESTCVGVLACNESPTQVFSYFELCEICKNTFLIKHLRGLLLSTVVLI